MAGIASSSSSSSSEDLTRSASGPDGQNSESFVSPSDQAVNSLLQKRQCELMYELKRLQHGEKPVTGSESRDKVGNFFDRRINRQDAATSSGVANVDNVEEHRPEQVVIEVEGLLQRRSVSSVLGSERFRRSLENVVRSHLRPAPPRQRQRAADIPTPPSHTPVLPSAADGGAAAPNNTTNITSDRIPVVSSLVNPNEEEGTEEQLPELRRDAEDFMRSLNHDELVMEISELVHQQLVSSTLSGAGGFRNRLERLVMNRVSESGTDGRAVQEQIHRLPPSNIRRNDFSHLGLQGPGANPVDLDDAVSVISATASATIPYAQTNAAVNREINAMKSQIAQLTSMLRMSLDLQTDIQRSIKQEVAAAMNQNRTEGAAAIAVPPKTQSRRVTDSKCIVCVEGDADCVLYRCGHICMCYSCAVRMQRENGTCPVCRAPINDIVRAYRISHD